MSTKATKFDSQSFREAISGSAPVLVDFYADWCPPCKIIAPTIEEVAGMYEGRAIVGKLDVESNADVAGEYDVRNIPTILVFVDGEVVRRFVGIVSDADLSEALDDALSRVAA